MSKAMPIVAAVATFVGFTSSQAQEWPTRAVTFVVPYAAGGSSDVIARFMAPRISELLGQQVIIENIPGAGGMTGSARAAKARPDGYQFLFGNVGTHAQGQTLYKSPPYNAATDFTPVALVAEIHFILTARKSLPAANLQEFMAYAKAHQGKMQYGSGGTGSPVHLACALFNAAVGINVTHVPYRGDALATQDVVSGQIDYVCPSVASAIGSIEGKLVKPIAILSKDRSPLMPDYPSAHEQGLANFGATGWTGIFAPKGTPAPIIEKLNAAAVAAMDTPAIQERFRKIGAVVVTSGRRSPHYFQAFVESEIANWAAAIKAAGLAATQ